MRSRKLGIECMSGIDDKSNALVKWLKQNAIDPAATIYIGNDLNDLSCMELVGFAVAPADARPEARNAAQLVLENRGGWGAVRELADLVISKIHE